MALAPSTASQGVGVWDYNIYNIYNKRHLSLFCYLSCKKTTFFLLATLEINSQFASIKVHLNISHAMCPGDNKGPKTHTTYSNVYS